MGQFDVSITPLKSLFNLGDTLLSSKIFISYRREDTAGFAFSIKERLERALGKNNFFLDAESIGVGADFVHSIEVAISESKLLLVLIGKRWNPGRLREPNDIVLHEIQAALRSGVHIVPLLLENVPMPRENEVPKEIALFTRRQAMEIRTSNFNDDLEKLLAKLKILLGIGGIRRWIASRCSPEFILFLFPWTQILLSCLIFGIKDRMAEGMLLSFAALPSLAAIIIRTREPFAAALFLISGMALTSVFSIIAMTTLRGHDFLVGFTAFLGFSCCAAYGALAFLFIRDDRARSGGQK